MLVQYRLDFRPLHILRNIQTIFSIFNLFGCFYVKVENYWNFTSSKTYYSSTVIYRRIDPYDNNSFQDLAKIFHLSIKFQNLRCSRKQVVFRNLRLYSILSNHILLLCNDISVRTLCCSKFFDFKSKLCLIFTALKRNSEYCKNCYEYIFMDIIM